MGRDTVVFFVFTLSCYQKLTHNAIIRILTLNYGIICCVLPLCYTHKPRLLWFFLLKNIIGKALTNRFMAVKCFMGQAIVAIFVFTLFCYQQLSHSAISRIRTLNSRILSQVFNHCATTAGQEPLQLFELKNVLSVFNMKARDQSHTASF